MRRVGRDGWMEEGEKEQGGMIEAMDGCRADYFVPTGNRGFLYMEVGGPQSSLDGNGTES